jgi:hypothetical protein
VAQEYKEELYSPTRLMVVVVVVVAVDTKEGQVGLFPQLVIMEPVVVVAEVVGHQE